GHLTRRNRSFCPSRHTHDDSALQDPCSNRSHRLRQVQRTLLPEPTVWIPPDPLGCCTAARQPTDCPLLRSFQFSRAFGAVGQISEFPSPADISADLRERPRCAISRHAPSAPSYD